MIGWLEQYYPSAYFEGCRENPPRKGIPSISLDSESIFVEIDLLLGQD